MFFDNLYKNRHIMQEFEDTEIESVVFLIIKKKLTKMNIIYEDGKKLIHSDEADRLYLLVDGSNEVYVDNFLLEQHQIDGLRFIFRLFNKKCPGIVVNFPPACGKSATVALFLNTVTNILKNPVLIICKDANEMLYWKEILLKWSSYVDDEIAVESLNPFIKGKKVFLKTHENMTSYLRRHWSIVIIKENMDMFKLKFEADFKIFITSTDIKKDLGLLSKVYTWLYPKPKTTDNVTENVSEVEISDRKRHLKNKDATGTKTKRSKNVLSDNIILNRIIDQSDVSLSDIKKNNDFDDSNANDPTIIIIDDSDVDDNNANRSNDKTLCKLDVESFIRNQKPVNIHPLDKLSFLYDREISKIKSKFTESNLKIQDSEDKNSKNSDLGTKQLLQKEKIESGDSDKSSVKDESLNFAKDSEKEETTESLRFEISPVVNQTEIKNLNETPNSERTKSTEAMNFKKKSKVTLIDVDEINTSPLMEESTESLSFSSDPIVNIDEMKGLCNKNMLKKQLIQSSGVDDDECRAVKVELQGEIVNQCASDLKDNELSITKVEQDGDSSEGKNVNDGSNKTKSDNSGKDLDNKISLMEERALKKFKGSILDSLF
ncbi:jg16159 [Pararge aegeria aegeria]|uniref:Jg16159 protein n=2 Tax=Pararge aegeria TaxID=116150 RepID=A0A8S4RCZ6_9NEOP|nr:jg16159 [Pararge aegeria aegeria]